MAELEVALRGKKPGDSVSVVVGRDGSEKTLDLVLGQHPQDPEKPLLGVNLAVSRGRPLPDRPVDAEERALALRQLADHLASGYLYPEKGEAFAAQVREAADADRFAEADRLQAFIAAVNEFLLEVSDDRHLWMGFDTGEEAPGVGSRRVRRVVGGPAGGGAAAGGPAGPERRVRVAGDHGGGHADGPERPRPLPAGDGDRGHGGFAGFEVLDGNVGYVDLRGFSGDESSKAKRSPPSAAADCGHTERFTRFRPAGPNRLAAASSWLSKRRRHTRRTSVHRGISSAVMSSKTGDRPPTSSDHSATRIAASCASATSGLARSRSAFFSTPAYSASPFHCHRVQVCQPRGSVGASTSYSASHSG